MAQKKNRLLVIFLIIVLLAAGAAAWLRIAAKLEKGNKPAQASLITVSTSILKTQTINQVLNFEGLVEGDPQVKIYPKLSGKLQSLNVHEGEWAAKDQPLMLINRDIAGSDFMLAPVKAPISGVITRLYFTDIGSEIFLDKPVAEIANPRSLKLILSVGETDLLKLAVGQSAELWSISEPARRLLGQVDSVSPFIDRDSLTGVVTIKLSNPNSVLKIGMSCGVTIKIGSHSGFVVPEDAIVLGMGQAAVYRFNNGIATQIPVTLGYAHNGVTEIKGDLQEGDQLITIGAFKVYDRAAVQLTSPTSDQAQP